MKIEEKLIFTGALFGTTGVILGAFAAHGLKPLLDANSLESFQTGVRYQIYHSLFLLFIAGISIKLSSKRLNIIFVLTTIGVILFSGSIYLLNLAPIFQWNFKFLGPITPIGGLMLIISWSLLAISMLKKRK